jgi:hypothetical protein
LLIAAVNVLHPLLKQVLELGEAVVPELTAGASPLETASVARIAGIGAHKGTPLLRSLNLWAACLCSDVLLGKGVLGVRAAAHAPRTAAGCGEVAAAAYRIGSKQALRRRARCATRGPRLCQGWLKHGQYNNYRSECRPASTHNSPLLHTHSSPHKPYERFRLPAGHNRQNPVRAQSYRSFRLQRIFHRVIASGNPGARFNPKRQHEFRRGPPF